MGAFLTENIITIIFGITTFVTAMIALHYQRLEHKLEVDKVIESGRRAGLFLSREAMMTYLLEMYDKAQEGDVIWAQCVRCADFSPEVHKKILKAAGKNVAFRMMINKNTPSLSGFQSLFSPVHNAEVVESEDNVISMQGLSEREVVIALPDIESYTAVLIREEKFVKILKVWFDTRFNKISRQSNS